jgi:hypothetical protein
MQKMDLNYFCTQAGDCGINPYSIYCIFLLINLRYINEVVRTSKRNAHPSPAAIPLLQNFQNI